MMIRSRDWPMPTPLAEDIASLARKVSNGGDSIIRWSSRLVRRKIQVPPMSDAWLQMHEADHVKHGPDT